MSKIHFVINICDNELLLLDTKQKKIVSKKFQSIDKEQIVDKMLFYDELNRLLKEHHIRIPLFGWNGCFISSQKITNIIKEKYQEILSEYFTKIKFKTIEDVVNTKNDIAYIKIVDTYIEYYFSKKGVFYSLYVDLQIFNKNIKKTINHLLTQIYKPKKIIVFGNYKDIPKIAEEILHTYNIDTKFPELPTHFILEEYKK